MGQIINKHPFARVVVTSMQGSRQATTHTVIKRESLQLQEVVLRSQRQVATAGDSYTWRTEKCFGPSKNYASTRVLTTCESRAIPGTCLRVRSLRSFRLVLYGDAEA